jgi:hypothetical protein
MTPTTAPPVGALTPAQAAELAELVELEASWENLREAPPPAAARPASQGLHGIQRAYDAFRTKLGAFNRRCPPGHAPELLLNTPARLGAWCRRMRDLYLRVEDDPRVRYPAQLLEKARRRAGGIAARTGRDCPPQPAPPADRPAAARELEALGQWCDELAGVGAALRPGG